MKKINISEYSALKKGLCLENDNISEDLYQKYSVNRGLRDLNGKGVLTGLTNISEVVAFKEIDGVKTPVDGELWYRGFRVNSLIDEISEDSFGFERIAYLLLFGEKPSEEQFEEFSKGVKEYIDYYNNKRIQAKTKWMTPVEYRKSSMCSA